MGLFASGKDGKRVFYKTSAEIELMRNANLVVSKALAHVAGMLKPGVQKNSFGIMEADLLLRGMAQVKILFPDLFVFPTMIL